MISYRRFWAVAALVFASASGAQSLMTEENARLIKQHTVVVRGESNPDAIPDEEVSAAVIAVHKAIKAQSGAENQVRTDLPEYGDALNSSSEFRDAELELVREVHNQKRRGATDVNALVTRFARLEAAETKARKDELAAYRASLSEKELAVFNAELQRYKQHSVHSRFDWRGLSAESPEFFAELIEHRAARLSEGEVK